MADDKNTLYDNAIGYMIILATVAALFLFFWYYTDFQYWVKDTFRMLRWSEMWLASFFVDDDYTVIWGGYGFKFGRWLEEAPKIPSQRLDGMTLGALSMLAMRPMRMFFVISIALMGTWALVQGPGTQFRRKMGLDGLIGSQSKTFPVISPFMKFNPSSMPPRPPGAPVPAELPLFAEALGPEEWVAYNEIPVPDGHLDEHAAYLAFAKQLGGRWEGPLKMAPYKQILMACFCLKARRKRKEADEMLGRIAKCWSAEGGLQLNKDSKLLKDAQAVLRNKDMAENILSKCNQHAFETAAMLRGLLTAREEGGVLAPAQFVWLRGHDRVLWYPLNNLGRQSFHIEALGAMAHFKAERMTRRPIPKPKVQDAVKTISDYMRSRRARPIPQLDYSKAKGKRGIKQPKKR